MPRIVTGYTELNTQKISSKVVMELRDDIATGIATLTSPVPGLAELQGGLISIGMSTDLLAARTFYSERLDALEAKPFECELFAEFQASVEAGREVLNQPLPPVAYGFRGFLAVVEGLEGMDLANGVPPTSADMRLLVAMDNAASLVAMGAMFSPELATMNIEADGQPVKLALPQIDAVGQEVFVAMTDDALSFSVGSGMEDGLGDMMKAAAVEPSPFLVVDMDAARYYALIDQAISAQAGGQGDMPEVLEATQAMSQSIRNMMDRIRVVVNFTENGIEFESELQLAE